MSNIDRVVSAALELNLSIRNSHLRQMMGPIAYAHDYCSIRIDAGRQTGKTDYIMNVANDNDLVIVHDEHSARWLLMCGVMNVFTIHQFRHFAKGRGFLAIEKVYIDEPKLSLPKPDDLLDLYKITTGNDHEPTFIFLGIS